MQRYLWQQADGRRHAYDTQTTPPARDGQPFTALCGDTVTPRVAAGDVTTGLWFDPECQVCTITLAHAQRWPIHELVQLVRRFDWTTDQIARIATTLQWTPRKVAELVSRKAVAR